MAQFAKYLALLMSVAVTTAIPFTVSVDGVRVRVRVSAATAGPSEKARSARAHTETGNAYFNLEKYKEAIGEFEQAYLDKQDPAIFFNIGECHRLLGNNAEAIRFLRRFLQETHNHPNRVKAEERLADLERANAVPPPAVGVPLQPTRPTTPPPPVAVVPPAAPVTPTTVAPLPAPPQPVTAAPPAPVLEPGALAIAAAPAPAPTSTPVYEKWWFWTAIGAVVVAGVVVGVASSASPSRPACPSGVVCQ